MSYPHLGQGRISTILVVDDDRDCRAGLEVLLGREGYRVVMSADGQQALSCIRAGVTPDLILLDMLLPIVDGFAFLDRLHSLQSASPMPIIIMSELSLGQEWAEEHACACFVQKPIDSHVLFEEIDRCLSGGRISATAEVTI